VIRGIPATVNRVKLSSLGLDILTSIIYYYVKMSTLDRIKELEKQRTRIVKQILSIGLMLPGAYKEVYCKCGKPNCWCYKKGGHSFRRITWSENGRSRTKAIPEEDISWIQELTGNYREFQKKRRQIKELEGVLKDLLGEHATAVTKKSRRLRDYLRQKQES
jgi:hypothetical protein